MNRRRPGGGGGAGLGCRLQLHNGRKTVGAFGREEGSGLDDVLSGSVCFCGTVIDVLKAQTQIKDKHHRCSSLSSQTRFRMFRFSHSVTGQ